MTHDYVTPFNTIAFSLLHSSFNCQTNFTRNASFLVRVLLLGGVGVTESGGEGVTDLLGGGSGVCEVDGGRAMFGAGVYIRYLQGYAHFEACWVPVLWRGALYDAVVAHDDFRLLWRCP